jgi:outer membrane protein assembly factor BamB
MLDNGRPLWSDSVLRPRRSLAVSTISDITGAPVISDGRVYVAGASGEMAALEVSRGGRQWETELTSYDTPLVAGEFVYTVTARGELVCLLRQGGHIRWVTRVLDAVGDEDLEPGTLWSGPVMVGGRLVLVGSSGDILTFEPTNGTLIGRASLPDGAKLAPVVADGIIYVLTEEGDIVAFR